MIKNKILSDIVPFFFEGKLIIALDEKWIKYFNTENPIFQAFVNDGKYVLVGPHIITKPTRRNIHNNRRDVSNDA